MSQFDIGPVPGAQVAADIDAIRRDMNEVRNAVKQIENHTKRMADALDQWLRLNTKPPGQ